MTIGCLSALSVLAVCGAPGLAARYVHPGARVLVLGAGKTSARPWRT